MLQETHMSNEEHNKLKRFRYLNSFYSSCKNSRKRGVAIMMSNSLNLDLIKEEGDKEGRYILVKGKLDNVLSHLLVSMYLQKVIKNSLLSSSTKLLLVRVY